MVLQISRVPKLPKCNATRGKGVSLLQNIHLSILTLILNGISEAGGKTDTLHILRVGALTKLPRQPEPLTSVRKFPGVLVFKAPENMFLAATDHVYGSTLLQSNTAEQPLCPHESLGVLRKLGSTLIPAAAPRGQSTCQYAGGSPHHISSKPHEHHTGQSVITILQWPFHR